jgi:hypothetical protein
MDLIMQQVASLYTKQMARFTKWINGSFLVHNKQTNAFIAIAATQTTLKNSWFMQKANEILMPCKTCNYLMS